MVTTCRWFRCRQCVSQIDFKLRTATRFVGIAPELQSFWSQGLTFPVTGLMLYWTINHRLITFSDLRHNAAVRRQTFDAHEHVFIRSFIASGYKEHGGRRLRVTRQRAQDLTTTEAKNSTNLAATNSFSYLWLWTSIRKTSKMARSINETQVCYTLFRDWISNSSYRSRCNLFSICLQVAELYNLLLPVSKPQASARRLS